MHGSEPQQIEQDQAWPIRKSSVKLSYFPMYKGKHRKTK
jgi:hypothetical protein